MSNPASLGYSREWDTGALRLAFPATIALALLLVIALWGITDGDGVALALEFACVLIFTTNLAYFLAWRPRLTASQHGVVIVNPLATHVFAWSDITEIVGVRMVSFGVGKWQHVGAWAVQSGTADITLSQESRVQSTCLDLERLRQHATQPELVRSTRLMRPPAGLLVFDAVIILLLVARATALL